MPQSAAAARVLSLLQLCLGVPLAAPRLYPAVCQTAKQGKRWDKWLFMICHIPSSLLSPGPIYYSCRLPPCRREHAHTNTKYCTVCALARRPGTHAHARTHADFFQYLVLSKATYLRHSLLSCHLLCCRNSPNFISSSRWRIGCYTSHIAYLHKVAHGWQAVFVSLSFSPSFTCFIAPNFSRPDPINPE